LPPNYTLPTAIYDLGENIDNSTPLFIESQQPQLDHTTAHVSQPVGETHDGPQDHILIGFMAYSGYTTEEHALSSVPMPNALRAPQYRLLSQPLCFVIERGPPAVVEKENFNHI